MQIWNLLPCAVGLHYLAPPSTCRALKQRAGNYFHLLAMLLVSSGSACLPTGLLAGSNNPAAAE
jgi:hypothetical protein